MAEPNLEFLVEAVTNLDGWINYFKVFWIPSFIAGVTIGIPAGAIAATYQIVRNYKSKRDNYNNL